MTVGLRRRTRRETAQAVLEREAAEIIDERIAAGRPPPEVWQAAAARRDRKGFPADAWYRPANAPASATSSPATPERRREPVIGRDFVLRVVHLPADAAPSPGPPPGPGGRAGRVAAGTSN